jgi:hypothetical protein
MLKSVKQEVIDMYWNDQMSHENLGPLHYTSNSCYQKLHTKTVKKLWDKMALSDKEIDDIVNYTCFSQACEISGEFFSDDFIREFAADINWLTLTKHRYISPDLLFECKEYIDINYFLNQGIFNKFDILDIK